jgi:hypothetical protein
MWIFTILVGLCLGAWVGSKYSIAILTATLLLCDLCLLAAGLAAGWGILYLALILFAATITLQAGYLASVSYRGGIADSWRLPVLRSVARNLQRH